MLVAKAPVFGLLFKANLLELFFYTSSKSISKCHFFSYSILDVQGKLGSHLTH